ncbi:MAG: glycoside hydrolase family 25 protein [Bacteroidota bacterium]|nr:glycoside hydrolase family 25 protein [Bacteroidota bacterium]
MPSKTLELAKKKKYFFDASLNRWLLSSAIAILSIWGVIFFIQNYKNVYYPDFKITIPSGYQIHGIDVSKYQDQIDWQAVKTMEEKGVKIGFVFIKATEGLGNVDNQFRRNWIKAGQENICKGAYHYFIAGKSGRRQAANFIETVSLKKGDLPPVLDIERAFGVPAPEIKKEVTEWLGVVEKFYGVKPVIYTNIDFYTRYLQDDFPDYPVWIAHYLQPVKPRIDHEWAFWQHSDSGRVNGIKTPVDFNVFSGDSADFKKMLVP